MTKAATYSVLFLTDGADTIEFVSYRATLTTKIANSKGQTWTEPTEQARTRVPTLLQSGWRVQESRVG